MRHRPARPSGQTQPAIPKGREPVAFLIPLLFPALLPSLASVTYLFYIYIDYISVYIYICHLFFFFCSPLVKITMKPIPPHWTHFITRDKNTNGSSENPASELPSQFSFYRDRVFHFVWKILDCFESLSLDYKKAIL